MNREVDREREPFKFAGNSRIRATFFVPGNMREFELSPISARELF